MANNVRVLVCLDKESADHLELTGLGIETFDAFPLVSVGHDAGFCRRTFAVNSGITCAFVVSCDDMAPLNLAAALKADCPEKTIYLVSNEDTRQLRERVACGGVDGLVPEKDFADLLLKKQATVSAAGVEFPLMRESLPVNVASWFRPLYAQAPLVDAELLEDLDEPLVAEVVAAEPERAIAPMKQTARAFYLPVVGSNGGVGKSTVAYLSALCAARMGCKTLLIDFDVQFGDMAAFAGDDAALHIDELLADPVKVELLKPGAHGFALLAACSSLEASERVVDSFSRVFDLVTGDFDVIISNSSCYWTDQHIALLERAGKVLFVIDQRPATLQGAQRAFDLCLRCGLAASPFVFALNRCGRQNRLTFVDVSCALKGAQCIELPDGGRDVEEYFSARQASELLEERNELAEAINDFLMDTLPGCSVLKGIKKEPRFSLSLFSRGKKKGV